ncbi:MAG: LysR family transcriptional regulator [Oscillospiraceae bacterium]|nr:LysR family transcriptional regulator [Oscillospiraceae bacterium]
MDITQLKYFIALAQTLNFSEAARRCGITQPSMSHNIGELEKQLGAPLFLRSKKNVSITEAGRELLPSALEMVDIAEKAAFRIHQMELGKTGSVTISALTTSSAVLSKCLKAFSQKYPDILTDITFTSGRSEVLAMNEAKFDFHFAVQEMVPAGESFDSLASHVDHLCVAFPADHPLAGEPLDFSRLSGERFIAVSESDGPALYNEIRRVCEARNFTPNVVCQYDRAEAVLLSVGAGTGIAIVPEALGSVFYAQNVKLVRIPGSDAIRTYVVAWRRNMGNPAARLFLEVIRELFE